MRRSRRRSCVRVPVRAGGGIDAPPVQLHVMIEFREASRRFGRGRGGIDALRAVTLAIPKGRVTAVVGPNGAGKSTLFALALGFIAPTSGQVTINGEDPRAYVRRRGVGYMPERFALPPEWPVGRTLDAFARIETRESAAAVADATLGFGLSAELDREAGSLSRGTLQRLGLALAMLVPHELLILDEPTEGLDPLWRIRLRDILKTVRSRGSTVLLASHDLAEVGRIADVVVLLDSGRIVEHFETQPDSSETRTWRLRLASAADHVADVFPGAQPFDDGREFLVDAADEADLSARLAALLASGAIVSSLEPSTEALETRVRRALEEGSA
jgi:ABC-2 type transport system ATP-binding protein